MSDARDDAAPTREGQAVTPQSFVTFGIGPDGQFFLDCTEDEMVVRGLLALGWFELDRYFTKKRYETMMAKAQETAALERMAAGNKAAIDKVTKRR